MKTRIIIVGGFLGAGKTTLIMNALKHLDEKREMIGVITNDQASELVDTRFLKYINDNVLEVSGSCFCCNFKGFSEAIESIRKDKRINTIIAEPVGSCTDLSATIFQPLKDHFGNELDIAPLSVLVSPSKLRDILDNRESKLHTSALYIIEKQMEEADFIVINKSDLLKEEELKELKSRAEEKWPLANIINISAKTGEGVKEWLQYITNCSSGGTHLAKVDYDIYAKGEAVLGWLNAAMDLKGDKVNWDGFSEKLMDEILTKVKSKNSEIGHIKLIINTDDDKYVISNLTGLDEKVDVRSRAGFSDKALLTFNARVQMTPEELESIFKKSISYACGKDIAVSNIALKSLSPGRPNPTYCYDYVVR